MFCDEQYDCTNVLCCAVVNTLNKRVTIATSTLDRVGLADAIVVFVLGQDSEEPGKGIERI